MSLKEKQIKTAGKIAKEADKVIGAIEEFEAAGTFKAIHAAEKYAKAEGYNVGSMCRDMPIALSKEAEYIAKWRNIDPSEYLLLGGVLLSDDFREGSVLFVELVPVAEGRK